MSDSNKLREHADKIKAAFEAAEADGFVLSFEYDFDDHENNVLTEVSLDLNWYEWHETEHNGRKTRRRKVTDWTVLREESF